MFKAKNVREKLSYFKLQKIYIYVLNKREIYEKILLNNDYICDYSIKRRLFSGPEIKAKDKSSLEISSNNI